MLHFALSDSPLDALRVLPGLIFPKSAWLEDRYGLRGPFAPRLMAVIHPVVVLMQLLGSCGAGETGGGGDEGTRRGRNREDGEWKMEDGGRRTEDG